MLSNDFRLAPRRSQGALERIDHVVLGPGQLSILAILHPPLKWVGGVNRYFKIAQQKSVMLPGGWTGEDRTDVVLLG